MSQADGTLHCCLRLKMPRPDAGGRHATEILVTKLSSWQMEDNLHWLETYIHLTLLLLPDLDERLVEAWQLLCSAVCPLHARCPP